MLLFITQIVTAQTGQAITSNLDDTAGITSHGSHTVNSSGGPVALPEDLRKINLLPGQILEMSVYNTPEMSCTLTVDDAGDIRIPLVGVIHVAGETLRTAETVIAQALIRKQILNDPEVTLTMTAYTSSSVLVAGEVQQPGKVQVLAARPLLEIIASVGGVTTAAGGDIEICHKHPGGNDEIQHISYANNKEPVEAQNALIYPGDSIFVRRAGVVYVLGAVFRPGGFLMVNGGNLTLTQAIASAAGTNPIASPANTIIVRRNKNGIIQIKPRLDKAQRGIIAPIPLQDGDMIYVPTSKIKSTLVNSSAVLSSAASAVIYAGVN
jgi:polysaccharide export outer membrane protein